MKRLRHYFVGLFVALLSAQAILPALASDRVIVYPLQNPSSTQQSLMQRYPRLTIGNFLRDMLGSSTASSGAYTNMTINAGGGLFVNVSPSLANNDGTLYQAGQNDPNPVPQNITPQLAADPTVIMLEGILNTTSSLIGPIAVPGTAGQSQYTLIEAQLQSQDTNAQQELFVNQAGGKYYQTVNTDRTDAIIFQAKAGTAGTSPTVPSTDTGWVAIGKILVPYGTSTITSGMITMSSPFPGFITTTSSITAVTGTTPISVSAGPSPNVSLGTVGAANGGTGVTTIPTGGVVLGAGTSPVTAVTPGATGNVLQSNGSTWISATPAPSGVSSVTASGNLSATAGATPNVTITAAPSFTNTTVTSLTPGDCVQAGTGGLLTSAAAACGSGGGGGVSSFSAGTTGFTPSSATTGAVTLSGTLGAANGGTGITSLGTGVATALGAAVTGSGSLVLATSPNLTTPNLGAASGTTLSLTGAFTPGYSGTAGTAQVYSGTGTPAFSAPAGSIFLSYSGTGGATDYFNSSTAGTSGTSWTAIGTGGGGGSTAVYPAPSASPFPEGCVYNSTLPTTTSGNTVQEQCDVNGRVLGNLIITAPSPIPVTAGALPRTYAGGTITAGGTAQNWAAAAAIVHGCDIQNTSNGAEYIRMDGTAASTTSLYLAPSGGYYECPLTGLPTTSVSIYGATTGQSFYAEIW